MFRNSSLHIIRQLFLIAFFFAFFFVALFFLSYSEAFADGLPDSEKRVLTVGYHTGYGFIDSPNSLDKKGFGYEVLTRAAHYSDYTFKFVEYNFIDGLIALQHGKIDVMGMMLDDGYLQGRYSKASRDLGSVQLILATKNENVYYDDPSLIDGKTVASYYGNPYEKHLNKYCEENAISVNYVRDNFYNYTNLETDFYLVTTIDHQARNFYMVVSLETFSMYFITNIENEYIAEDLTRSINLSIKADGRFLDSLQMKYYGKKNLTRRYLTAAEMALLRSHTLTCGYISNHEPIQHTNSDGLPEGISIAVMNNLAKKYGFNIEYIPYNHDMPLGYHENFDILIAATGNYQHASKFYISSAPFLELPLMLLAKEDFIENILSKNEPSQLGMINYITLDNRDITKRYPNNTLKTYNTFEDLVNAYINGEIDGILATEYGVEHAKLTLGEDVYSIRSTGLVLPLRVFLNKKLDNLTEYTGVFNILFDHIEQESIDEIMSSNAVSFMPKYSLKDFIQKNLVTIVTFVLIILGSMILYFQYKGKRMILKVINNDDLTKLRSVYRFKQKASHILETADSNEYEIISLDIDSFHTINKLYRLEKGNQVIQAVANELDQAYKGTSALLARVIADHFIIFNKAEERKDIKTICEEKIAKAVKAVVGENYNISMSVGTCLINDCSSSINEYIDYATAARLQGKDRYRFTYNIYNEELKKEREETMSVVYRMQEALTNKEFTVFYQPKVKFDTLKIGGAEALVRWHPLDGSVKMPDMFISIFESNGFIVNLDLYVFEEVCKFIVNNKDKTAIPKLSVNVSAITLFDETFPSAYLEILAKYNLSPELLELEITESAMALDKEILVEKVREIKDLGFSLSIDDFGVGASSLNRLSSITADTIKLDKAFLDYSIAEKKGAIVVDNLIRMAKELDMEVVSEGIETKEQVMWLKSLNCNYAQGYFFEKPMPENDFILLLQSDKIYDER